MNREIIVEGCIINVKLRFDFCYGKIIFKLHNEMKNTYNILPKLKMALNSPFHFFEKTLSNAVGAINSAFTFDDVDFYH